MKRLQFLLALSLTSLKMYGFRTFLTVLGIVVGVATVVTVLSVGNGVQQLIVGQLESFGGNTIFTEVRTPLKNSSGLEIAEGIQITTLKESDQALVEELPNVRATYGVVMGQEKVTGPVASITTPIMGTDAAYPLIDDAAVAEGQFFSDRDNARLARVVVLGSETAERLFDQESAVGRSVRIGGSSYRVIGVMEPRGTVFFQNMDLMVYMPKRTVQKLMLGIDYMLYFVAEVYDEERVNTTAEQIRSILRRTHNIPPNDPDKDDFRVTTMEEALSLLQTITTGAQLVLLLVACVSLIVGGVGIMNTMYVSVVERTKEIGIKRSLGALERDILWQFLLEAFLITSLGSVIGIVLGSLLSLGIEVVAEYFGFGWNTPLSWEGMLLSYGTASIFGLGFGYYPAKKAATLDPVYALRFEN